MKLLQAYLIMYTDMLALQGTANRKVQELKQAVKLEERKFQAARSALHVLVEEYRTVALTLGAFRPAFSVMSVSICSYCYKMTILAVTSLLHQCNIVWPASSL